MKRSTIVLLSALLAGVGVRAQENPPDPARLQSLLQELGKLDPKAWAARASALEQAAKVEEQKAQELRAQAGKLQEQAAAADAAAKQVRAEITRLQELEKLLRGMSPAAVQAAPAAAPVVPPAVPPAAPPAAAPTAAPAPPPAAASMPIAPAAASAATAPATAPITPPTVPAAVAAPTPIAPTVPVAPATAPKVREPEASSAAVPAVATVASNTPTTLVDWAAVEPLLQDRCSACHEPAEKKGGLDVTSFAAMRAGGGSGRTLVPGEPEQSRLYLMVSQQERPFMPRGEDPLLKEQVGLLRTWIEQGASETAAAARAFLAAREAAARASAAPDAVAAMAGPLPKDLPVVSLHLPDRSGPVKALARSPNAPLLAMPGLHQVLLFDPLMQPLGVLSIDAAAVEQIAFSADGSQLVAAVGEAGKRGRAAVFDVASGRGLGLYGNERDVPLAVAVHGGAGLAAAGGASKRTLLWRQSDGIEVGVGAHDDFVLALQFSPDGTLLAAGDRAGEVRLWETSGMGLVDTLTGHRGAVHAVAFAPNGAQLATAGADGTVRAFDPASGKELWRQQAHEGQAFALAFGPEGRLASCGSDGRIVVFAPGGKPLGKSPAVGEWLYAVAFGPDGDTVWGGDWQGRVHRFVVGGKQQVMDAVVPLRSVQ